MQLIRYIYRVGLAIHIRLHKFISSNHGILLLYVNKVRFGTNIQILGFAVINVSKHNGYISIGNYFKMNSGKHYNQIGRQQPCYLIVGKNSKLEIGNNVGISSTTLICNKEIIIGDNVKIGGNVVIYDSDFHSLDYNKRCIMPEELSDVKKERVEIKRNVFIGAHSTILKGVTIGENSIVGACSVVVKNIPDNEIWAGNPAVFIRKIEF
jgi:acetyltransferase-like isoleucine patch superfamily enzyme